jgi:hypothetical protein
MSQEKNTIEEYDAILKEVRGLMVAKNADYGESREDLQRFPKALRLNTGIS